MPSAERGRALIALFGLASVLAAAITIRPISADTNSADRKSADAENGAQRGSPPGARHGSPDPAAAHQQPLPTHAAGNVLLQQAIRQLEQHTSVTAKIRHRTQLFGQQLVGSGYLWQLRSSDGPLVRYELTIQVADHRTSLLHVNNGSVLWIHQTVGSQSQISRVDLRRLRRRLASSSRVADNLSLPVGGLPQLLVSLNANFDFAAPQSVVFQNVPVWALAGTWNPDRLNALLSSGGDASVQARGAEGAGSLSGTNLGEQRDAMRNVQAAAKGFGPLPPQLPDRVFVLLGRDGLFPYRIEYRRAPEDAARAEAQNSASWPSVAVLTMEFYEVTFDADVDPLRFSYRPGDLEIIDRTDEYLRDGEMPAMDPLPPLDRNE